MYRYIILVIFDLFTKVWRGQSEYGMNYSQDEKILESWLAVSKLKRDLLVVFDNVNNVAYT